MSELDYWTNALQQAEAELAAAKRRTEVDLAAKKLQRAKAELKRLQAKQPTRRSGRSSGRVARA